MANDTYKYYLNMFKFINILVCFVMIVLVSPNLLKAAMTSNNYQIWQDAISVGGGEDQTSTNYSLADTLGEFGVGYSSSTSNSLRPGYRSGDSFLTFSVTPSSIEFGNLSSSATTAGSVVLSVLTNSITGVSVTYTGSTLTCSACSGTNTISAIGAGAVSSSIGSSQFGFNAIYSSGTSPAAASVSPYNSAGQYAFNSGDQIISAATGINETVFNINFIANISGTETAGIYTTSVVYTATANF